MANFDISNICTSIACGICVQPGYDVCSASVEHHRIIISSSSRNAQSGVTADQTLTPV